MPTAHVNGVKLYYQVTGDGFPLIFNHEFSGDYRSWKPQVNFFSRLYQVITYNNRGYPPSEVPTEAESYSQDILIEDLHQLLVHLKIPKAHIVGLSMGGNITLNFGIRHPEVCASLAVASCGSGSTNREQFERDARIMIEQLEKEDMKNVAESFSLGPARIQFRRKDPLGWQKFKERFAEHSNVGSALTYRGVQLKRPSIFELEDDLKHLLVPTLLLIGDEDDSCLEPAVFMKKHIPNAGLIVFPQCGHLINLEEPSLFNRILLDFFTAVEKEKWGLT